MYVLIGTYSCFTNVVRSHAFQFNALQLTLGLQSPCLKMVVYMFCTVTESCWEKAFSLTSGYCSKICVRMFVTYWYQFMVSEKKKYPVIPVALITTINKTSYHIKALSGLTRDFMQITVTVSVHIYTMVNAGSSLDNECGIHSSSIIISRYKFTK